MGSTQATLRTAGEQAMKVSMVGPKGALEATARKGEEKPWDLLSDWVRLSTVPLLPQHSIRTSRPYQTWSSLWTLRGYGLRSSCNIRRRIRNSKYEIERKWVFTDNANSVSFIGQLT